jgi:catechol 2,3-dioxygenase
LAETITPAAIIGEVQLTTSNLDRAVAFYQDRLGFQVIEKDGGRAVMGVGNHPLVTLVEKKDAPPRAPHGAGRGTTGLYHFAVLLPDRRSLANLLYHLAETETPVQGAADHGVSEALYLADLDGNGIELYRDRRRGEWPKDDLGRLQMGTDELDIDNLLLELRGGVDPWQGMPDGTVIGHIHLQVRDLNEAEQFYTRVLGFQIMQRYGSGAIFVSAGGYHHHIGLNVWAGVGAPPPPEGAVGLRWFEVCLPDLAALEAVEQRLKEAAVPYEPLEGGMLVRDPSQNGILFRV